MMRLKAGLSGARVGGIEQETVLAIMIAASVYDKFEQPFMVTAVTDSKHMPGSLHYVGLAVDLGMPSANVKNVLLQSLREALADDFDVVEEGDHIHIEFQPKRGVNLAV
jgi:hypothetical protein